MSKYISRKFILAAGFGIVGSIGFLWGKDIGPFTTFVGVVFGIFTGGDVGINAIHRDKPNPDNPI
jgi:hypothetical protein